MFIDNLDLLLDKVINVFIYKYIILFYDMLLKKYCV